MTVCDSVDGGNSRQGRFGYDFLLGDDFSESNQPCAFINLKKYVGRHIGDAGHQKNVLKVGLENELQQKFEERQKGVGVIVGTQAYKLLKLCRLYGDFEVDIMLLANSIKTV